MIKTNHFQFSMQILTTLLPKGMENFLEMLINKAIRQERLCYSDYTISKEYTKWSD